MASNKVTPILLAGSLFLAGMVNVADARIEPIDTTRPEDQRLTRMEDLVDVSAHHWAYDALEELVSKYDVIEGYQVANGKFKFKGAQYATRYELAAALRDVLYLVRSGKVFLKNSDTKTLSALESEFAPELGALKARTEALEARVGAIEADKARFKVGGDFTVGALGGFESGDNSYGDAVQAISRLRLTVDAPVYKGEEGKFLGEGRVRVRAVAALGSNTGGIMGQSRIAADASNGNQAGSNGSTNARQNVYLDRAGYEQDFNLFNNSHTLFAGILPWRDYFDKSAYRGDENTQFQNSALTNIPGMPTNATLAMAGVKTNFVINDDLTVGLTAAYGAPNERNVQNNYFANAEARADYNWANLDNRKTSVYAGLVGIFNDNSNYQVNGAPVIGYYQEGGSGPLRPVYGTNVLARSGTTNAYGPGNTHLVYFGLDQEIYKGIGLHADYMYNNARAGSAYLNGMNQNYNNASGFSTFGGSNVALAPRQAGSVALHIPTKTLGFRDGDNIGVGYAVTTFSDAFTSDGRDRIAQVVETYYNFRLNDRVSIIPSLQAGITPFGRSDQDLFYAGGLRTSIKF
ncbi:MAG: hypothetical protein ACK551_03000 [Vampirovibrionales bacterium]